MDTSNETILMLVSFLQRIEHRNCSKQYIQSIPIGSIGDILYHQAYVSFSERFMLNYESDQIEYLFPIWFDRFCIITPKAEKIPNYLAIFRCFSPSVLSFIMFSNTICSFCWYCLRRSSRNK